MAEPHLHLIKLGRRASLGLSSLAQPLSSRHPCHSRLSPSHQAGPICQAITVGPACQELRHHVSLIPTDPIIVPIKPQAKPISPITKSAKASLDPRVVGPTHQRHHHHTPLVLTSPVTTPIKLQITPMLPITKSANALLVPPVSWVLWVPHVMKMISTLDLL